MEKSINCFGPAQKVDFKNRTFQTYLAFTEWVLRLFDILTLQDNF